ncbi:MAG: M15 family metallopeptidase [Ruminococcus sp.]|nr:M15 family metallopeptidase [Ruminococcus sp.]
MSKQSQASKEKSIQRTKTLFEVFLIVAVIAGGGYIIKGINQRSETVGNSTHYAPPEISDEEESATEDETPKVIYENHNVMTKDEFHGNLILVNENYHYYSGDEKLVSITEMNEQKGRTLFSAVDDETNGKMMIVDEVYEPMASMIFDFYEATQLSNIIIYGAYRSKEFQQKLYEDDLAQTGREDSTRVAKAGYSEHESGLAFDFTTYPDYDYQGTGEYAWFTQNCYRYGFIIRYPEGKESITKIQSEPWHFRYVGKPHAYYMTKKNLCLEEYIDMIIKNYYYQSDSHLKFTDDEGQSYEIYFVLADDLTEITTIPVPSGKKFEVSGTNVNGFIVTVYMDGEKSETTTEETIDEDRDNDGQTV